jgi:hypothetical protein
MKKYQSVILTSAFLFVTVTLRGETSRPESEPWSVSQDTSGIRKYIPPFPSRENVPVGPRGLRWVTKSEFAFFNVSLMTGTDVMQADLLKLNHRIFNVSAMSVIDGHDPYAAKYFLPFGVKASLLNARYFNVTAGADMYLFPFGAAGTGRGTYYEGDYIFGSYSDELEYSFSQFIDARINIEASPFVGVKAFIGCRVPVTPYSIYNLTIGEMTYERGSPFVYAGISGSLQLSFPFNESVFYRCYNERDNRLRKARRSDSPTAYESIIYSYPGTPYAKEAGERLEYVFYSRAMNGTMARCDEYLSRYPDGKYLVAVKNRRSLLEEETAYLKAIKGSPRDLDAFLVIYPDGKYAGKARAQLNKLLEEIEFRVYQGALNGTFDSCDLYIEKYPSGKYTGEVKSLRAAKLEVVGDELYRDAMNCSFIECDRYLTVFPEGKYFAEVKRKRDQSYRESEAVWFGNAISGDLAACERYLKYYPSGRYQAEIHSRKTELTKKMQAEIPNVADKYTKLILEVLLSRDSSTHKTAGYAISDSDPFLLYVNRGMEPAPQSSGTDNDEGSKSGISQRSLGSIPGAFGEDARLVTWDINATLVGKDNNQPTTVIFDDRSGFMNTSGLRMLLKTAVVSTEGWLNIDNIRFELEQGVITYHSRKNPGQYSEGSVLTADGIRYILSSGEWTVLH